MGKKQEQGQHSQRQAEGPGEVDVAACCGVNLGSIENNGL